MKYKTMQMTFPVQQNNIDTIKNKLCVGKATLISSLLSGNDNFSE